MKLNDKVQFAKSFAAAAHEDAGQTYGTGIPYVSHLEHVYSVLCTFQVYDRTVLAAGYLHDTLEDTAVTKEIMTSIFGPEITALVWAVTDEPGANRKERKALTYPKIKASVEATQIKLADRIANVEHAVQSKNWRMFTMYEKEHADFTANLWSEKDLSKTQEMWDYLNRYIKSAKDGLDRDRKVMLERAGDTKSFR